MVGLWTKADASSIFSITSSSLPAAVSGARCQRKARSQGTKQKEAGKHQGKDDNDDDDDDD